MFIIILPYIIRQDSLHLLIILCPQVTCFRHYVSACTKWDGVMHAFQPSSTRAQPYSAPSTIPPLLVTSPTSTIHPDKFTSVYREPTHTNLYVKTLLKHTSCTTNASKNTVPDPTTLRHLLPSQHRIAEESGSSTDRHDWITTEISQPTSTVNATHLQQLQRYCHPSSSSAPR